MIHVPCFQRAVVKSLHGLPRFGHPDSFSSLLSSEEAERKEYTDGVIAFGVVLGVLAFVWCLVLLVLKYNLTEKRVGCAAGGCVQDVNEMRNNKLTRQARKKRILRNWRTQMVLLACTVLIPALSFLLVNHGLDAFFASLDEAQDLAASTRQLALDGIGVATDITYGQNRVKSILTSLQPESVCPNPDLADGSDYAGFFGSYNATLQSGMNEIDAFVDDHVSDIFLGLSQIAKAALYFDSSIETTESYDWLVKGFLIALNTINVFLFIGVCLTRCGLHHPLYQQFLSWLAVPAFCLVLCGSVLAVIAAAGLSVVNADFCSGGMNATTSPYGSPLGTLQDVFERKGFNSSQLPFQALVYYGNVRSTCGPFSRASFGYLRRPVLCYLQECEGQSPFSFLGDFKAQVESQSSQVAGLLQNATGGTYNISQVCGEESISMIEVRVMKLVNKLDEFGSTLETAVNLTACSNVQPLMRRLINGAPCSESPRGLAWLFGTTASILFVGLVMLSTRAGLYNPVIKPRRIKRREREFQEYKEYMASFYSTGDWKMDPEKEKDLEPAQTFDTGETTATRSKRSDSVSPSAASSSRSVYIEDDASRSTRRSRFRYHDPGVVYYSSDSDDSDEESEGDLSTLSSVISRIFLVRKAGAATLSPVAPSGVNTHRDPAKLRWLQPRKSAGDSVFQTPLETPRRSPRVEDDVRGTAVMMARETLEMLPLSPNSPDMNQPPQRPQKKHKHRGRTVGGSMMDD
jgi:hypothetical protein